MKMKLKAMPKAVSSALGFAAISVAIGLGFSSSVFAQSSEGSLSGQAKANAPVTITNVDTGSSREAKAEATGRFSFSKLSPGRYKVTSGGVTREVVVALGSGIQVNFDKVETIQVSGARISNIDVGSVESSTVFTDEQMRALPVARDPNAFALLAPGVVKGSPGLGAGGLPSFGGASVAENGYYINGFDVTNIRNFLSYATLPFEAISQQQIKTGGYGAEYGRSLGGVISLVTKRGTNEWKSGASIYWNPESGRAKGKNIADREPTSVGNFTVFQKDDKAGSMNVNAFAGGPIIKDRLFFFAIVEARDNRSTDFTQSTATESKSDKPTGMVKLDWQISNNHLLEFTGISNERKQTLTDYTNRTPYSTSLDGAGRVTTNETGGTVGIGKYTGYLTKDLTVSALYGKVDDLQRKIKGARVSGEDCPVVLETNLAEIGCWIGPFPGGGTRDPRAPDDRDKREAYRLDAEWNLGNHTIRAGYDAQKFTSSEAGSSSYTGGVYWRYFTVGASGIVNGVPGFTPGTQTVRGRILQSTSGSYEVLNAAAYIENSWRFNKNLLLYGGVRSESFDNKNGDRKSFVKADNLLAPRLGFSWDVNGDSTLKVFGNAGSYFIPVASNTNIRQTRSELFTQTFYTFSGRDPRTQRPLNVGAVIGIPQVVSNGALPNPATIADTKLKPMSQDEFILGFQRAWSAALSFGVKGTMRNIKNGFDDYCNSQGAIHRWARDNGFNNFDYRTAAGCVLLNPGRDLTLQVDVLNNGQLREVTIPARYLGLAKYERKYESMEFSFERPFDGKWYVQGSYTWSRTRGTAEGYVNSTINQEDAGITQDFDFGSFTDGSKGFLPNDRRHAFKLFGSYLVNKEVRMGFNAVATSGAPKSCIGFVPPSVADYNPPAGTSATGSRDYTTASSFYCLNNAGRTELTQQGSLGRTPWTYSVDMSATWMPKISRGNLSLQADVFNIFNFRNVVTVNQNRDFSRATSITPPGQLNQNYDQPTSFQAPRALRLSARYNF